MQRTRNSATSRVFRLALLACLADAHPLAAQNVPLRDHVLSVNPAISAVGAPASTTISIDTAVPLDATTFRPSSVRVFGRWSGPTAGRLSLENGGLQIRFIPNSSFFAGETVTVTLSDSIRFSNGDALVGGFAWRFWIESARSSLEMREVARVPVRRPGESFIQSYGAYAGDFNDDGWSDLVVPNEQPGDIRVFISNDGSYGDFEIYPLPHSVVPSTNEGGDFNGDGFLDLAVGSGGNEYVYVAFGDGTGSLTIASPLATEGNVRGLCVIDVDADGDDDIVTASRTSSSLFLLINNGDGTFRNRLALDGYGDSETSCAVGDANGDGIMDLFAGSLGSRHIALLLGNGRGELNLSDRTVISGRPWMLAAGDVNLDGYADVVAAGSDGNSVSVALSDGHGLLQPPVSYSSGLFPLAIDLGDVDGDGDLDMVSSNYQSANYSVFENLGDGTFRRDRSYRAGQAGSCTVLHDRDNDGDLDVTAIDELEDLLILFETDAITTGVHDGPESPHLDAVSAWPNPFSQELTLSLDTPPGERSYLTIHDVLGREIAALVDGPFDPSTEIRWAPEGIAAGVYVVILRTRRRIISTTIVLQR